MVMKPRALAACASFLIGGGLIVTPISAATPTQQFNATASTPVLGTPEQRAAEKILRTLLRDPAVKAIQAKLLTDLSETETGRTAEGRARLPAAIAKWTTSLILREIAADPEHPAILWWVDDTPHRWFGYEIGGMGVAGDNPDHIYRGTFIDGAGQYEITGQVDIANPPAQFSFEVTRGSPGKLVLKPQTPGHVDMGNQIALLTDQDIKVASDGTFRLTVGGKSANPNHLPTEPGQISINVRDVFSDWAQRPNRLTIRRIDATDVARLDRASLRQNVLADLEGYVRFWAAFKDSWLGGLAPNKIVGPVRRDGNWGFQAAARYRLAPDEAAVITTTRGAARYTGVQVTDAWMIASDATKYQTSLNTAQSKANADGSVTYVVAARDPGVANWLDTNGLHEGYVLLRWQGFEPGATEAGLFKDYRIIKLADLARDFPDVPRISLTERRSQLAKRIPEYANRLR